MRIRNLLPKYVNQIEEIDDGAFFCGAACIAMLIDEDPQVVANETGKNISDEVIKKYLESLWFQLKKISDGGCEETKWSYHPCRDDFSEMILALESYDTILYHFAGWDGKSSGHYAICMGYDYDTKKFIFYDPAGDRNKGYFGKGEEGANVEYSREFLKKAGIKRLWSIKLV